MRLFVAVDLKKPVKNLLANVQRKLSRFGSGVRWIKLEQLHLTLKFIGEVQDNDICNVSDAVERAVTNTSPFSLEIGRAGCFPEKGRVRVIWVGIVDPSGALDRCVDSIENELEMLGIAREPRKYSPHLTVGKTRSDDSDGALRKAVESLTIAPTIQSVSSATLMSSMLASNGPTYMPVSKVQFR